MNESRRRISIAGAVWIGALLLFAPPAFLATVWVAESAVEFADVSLPPVAGLVVNAAAVLIAVQVATEIAAWRLHGGDWLRRGGRRLGAARIALAAVVCVGALALIGLLTAAIAAAAVVPEEAPFAVLASVAITFGLAFALSVLRTVRAFRRGYRG